MDIGKIVLEEFNQWVYNDENQAGDKMQVVDAADLPQIIQNVVEKYNDIHNVAGRGEQLCGNLDNNLKCRNMCLTHCIDGNKFWK